MTKKSVSLVLFSGILSALQANSFELGVGAFHSSAQIKGVKDVSIPIPMVAFEYEGLYLHGVELGCSTQISQNSAVNVFVKPRLEGFSENDSDYLKSMQKRSYGVDAGVATDITHNELGKLQISMQADITGTNKGYETQAEYSKSFFINKVMLMPFVGINYRSQNLNNYFYGVKNVEVRTDRGFYKAKGGVDFTAGGRIMYEISAKTYMFAEVGCRHFSKDITDSPLVKNKDESHLLTFVAYRF